MPTDAQDDLSTWTMRDTFAQGAIEGAAKLELDDATIERVVDDAYKIADAMMIRRQQFPETSQEG